MNILFISHSASTYGAESSLWDLLANFHYDEYTPIVVCPGYGPLVSRMRQLGIKTYVFPHFSWYSHRPGRVKYPIKKVLHEIGAAFLLSLHAGYRFRLVYSNTLSSFVGALFAYRRQVPHLWHLHEFLGENIRARFDEGQEKCLKWMGRVSNRVIYNSETTKAAYAGWIPDAMGVVIPNGTPKRFFDAFSSRSTDKSRPVFELCIIGKIVPIKRIEVALKALAILRSTSNRRFHMSIVGDGDSHYVRSLRRMAEDLSVSKSIAWHGYQEDPLQFYERSNVLLVNSHLETFCRSACEAMASGCPVIVSDAGEPRRFVLDGETGCVYPEGDSALLAEQVKKLATDHSLRDRIIRQAHNYAKENFEMAKYAQRIMSVIRGIAGVRGAE
jgi:glycosyltransferase involved in cell wall biosynthesis